MYVQTYLCSPSRSSCWLLQFDPGQYYNAPPAHIDKCLTRVKNSLYLRKGWYSLSHYTENKISYWASLESTLPNIALVGYAVSQWRSAHWCMYVYTEEGWPHCWKMTWSWLTQSQQCVRFWMQASTVYRAALLHGTAYNEERHSWVDDTVLMTSDTPWCI